MTNLKNNLTVETLERTNRIFNIDTICLQNDTLIIKSRNTMTLDWAKYIANDLNIKCKYIEFKTNY